MLFLFYAPGPVVSTARVVWTPDHHFLSAPPSSAPHLPFHTRKMPEARLSCCLALPPAGARGSGSRPLLPNPTPSTHLWLPVPGPVLLGLKLAWPLSLLAPGRALFGPGVRWWAELLSLANVPACTPASHTLVPHAGPGMSCGTGLSQPLRVASCPGSGSVSARGSRKPSAALHRG